MEMVRSVVVVVRFVGEEVDVEVRSKDKNKDDGFDGGERQWWMYEVEGGRSLLDLTVRVVPVKFEGDDGKGGGQILG